MKLETPLGKPNIGPSCSVCPSARDLLSSELEMLLPAWGLAGLRRSTSWIFIAFALVGQRRRRGLPSETGHTPTLSVG